MVSWDIAARFEGLSPHIRELKQLAERYKFSNIEELTPLGNGAYRLSVNNRGTNQTEFKAEEVKN